MQEKEKLNKAIQLFYSGNKKESEKILHELYRSKDLGVKVNAISILLNVKDQIRENKQLIELASEGIVIANNLGDEKMKLHLLARKHRFLISEMSFLSHRKASLMLSAGVFEWIDFSLEENKKEYEAVSLRYEELLREVEEIEKEIDANIDVNTDHDIKGVIYMILGDSYGAKYLSDQISLMNGGKIKTKFANMHFIKRIKLDKYLLFNSSGRKKIRETRKKCMSFFERSIEELKKADNKSDLARSYYNLAIQHNTMYSFRKARSCLNKAQKLAEISGEEYLLNQIISFREKVKDQNRNIRNYTGELGLD